MKHKCLLGLDNPISKIFHNVYSEIPQSKDASNLSAFPPPRLAVAWPSRNALLLLSSRSVPAELPGAFPSRSATRTAGSRCVLTLVSASWLPPASALAPSPFYCLYRRGELMSGKGPFIFKTTSF